MITLVSSYSWILFYSSLGVNSGRCFCGVSVLCVLVCVTTGHWLQINLLF
jgi:hypothetical protein